MFYMGLFFGIMIGLVIGLILRPNKSYDDIYFMSKLVDRCPLIFPEEMKQYEELRKRHGL